MILKYKNKLQGKEYRFTSYDKFFKNIIKAIENFYDSLNNNKKYIGLRSKLEEFIAEINQYNYRIAMCITENKIGRIIREGLLKYGKLL